jgi:hypothetical protein
MAFEKLLKLRIVTDADTDGIEKASDDVGGLQKAVRVAGAVMTAFAVKEVAQATFELAKLGAQSLRTRNAFQNISGGTMEARANLEAMREATRGAMSDQEAMAAASQLLQMGLATNSDELQEMTTMAVRLGTAMGRDATQSVEEFGLLLANQSVQRLDTFGISSGKVRERVTELMDATEDMTREQAFMQATMEQGAVAMERLGDATEDAALKVEQSEAAWANFKSAIGEALAPTLGSLAEALRPVTEETQRQTDTFNTLVEVMGREEAVALRAQAQSARFGFTLETLARSVEDGRDQFLEHQATLPEYIGLTGSAAGATEGLAGAAQAANKQVEALGGKAGAYAQQLERSNVGTEQAFGLVSQMADEAGLSQEQIGNLAVELGVSSRAQVRANNTMNRAATAYANGRINAGQLRRVVEWLDRAQGNLDESTELAEEGLNDEADAAETVAEKQIDAAEEALALGGEMADLEGSADGAARALNSLPSNVRTSVEATTSGFAEAQQAAEDTQTAVDGIDRYVLIQVEYEEVNDPPPPPGDPPPPYDDPPYYDDAGGWSRVDAPPSGRRRRFSDGPRTSFSNTYNRGGDTYNIIDPLAAQIAIERAKIDRRASIKRGL